MRHHGCNTIYTQSIYTLHNIQHKKSQVRSYIKHKKSQNNITFTANNMYNTIENDQTTVKKENTMHCKKMQPLKEESIK